MNIIKESDIRKAIRKILNESDDEDNKLASEISDLVKPYNAYKKKFRHDADDFEIQTALYNAWYKKFFGDVSKEEFNSKEFRLDKENKERLALAKESPLFAALIGSVAPYIKQVTNNFWKKYYNNTGKTPVASKYELFYVLLKFATEKMELYDPSMGNKLITFVARGGEHVLYNKLKNYTNSMIRSVSYNISDRLAKDVTFIIKTWEETTTKSKQGNIDISSEDVINLYRHLRGFDGTPDERIIDMYNAINNNSTKSMSDTITSDDGTSNNSFGDTLSSDDDSGNEAEVNSQTEALKKLIPLALKKVKEDNKILSYDYTNEEVYNMLVAYVASDNKEGEFSSEYAMHSGKVLAPEETTAYFNDSKKIMQAIKDVAKRGIDKGVLEEVVNRILEKILIKE